MSIFVLFQKLKGNKDQHSIVRSFFPEAVVAQYIRIEPSFFHGAPALRFELLGCDTEGMRNKKLKLLKIRYMF
jgi:hypothetical protein